MPTAAPFTPYAASHLCALAVTAVLAAWMLVISRRASPMAIPAQRGLALLLAIEWPVSVWTFWQAGWLAADNGLPLHLCDVAALLGAFALWRRHHGAAEVAYFFGMAGTMQGLITPSLEVDYPHPRYFAFFLSHSGVVIAALTLAVGMGMGPRAGALRRALGWLLVYGAVAALANYLLSTNYGFTCAKPPVASALDLLGPWPWYLFSLFAVAASLFLLLDLPFALQRRALRQAQ